jgi:TonB family protein
LDLLSPVFIENEFVGAAANQSADEQVFEKPVQKELELKTEIVHEDYQIVDKVLEVEIPEELPALSHPDSSLINPEIKKEMPPHTEKNSSDTKQIVSTQTDEMPQFPGGITELIRFIYKHIQYPSAALKQRIQGRVWCSFTVNSDGSVSDIRLEEGVYIFLDEEAIRVLKIMPPWEPGFKAGKPVKMKVYLPIVFRC